MYLENLFFFGFFYVFAYIYCLASSYRLGSLTSLEFRAFWSFLLAYLAGILLLEALSWLLGRLESD